MNSQLRFLILSTLLFAKTAEAQFDNGLMQQTPHNLSVGAQASPHLSAVVSYLYNSRVQLPLFDKTGFTTQLRLPLFSQSGTDISWNGGVVGISGISGKFKLRTGLVWELGRSSDLNGNYLLSGFKLDLLPGFYSEKWIMGVHLSVNYLPWIHIRHSDYAKEAFHDLYPSGSGTYMGPKDGWFIQQNLLLQTGIGMTYLHRNWNLQLVGGLQLQPNQIGVFSLPDIGIMPFYGGMTFGYAFGKSSTE